MEGAARAVDEAGDAVFLGFRRVLAAQLAEPAGGVGGGVEVEQAGVEHRVQRHLAEAGFDDAGARIELAQDAGQPLLVRGVDQIGLVEHDHVAELHLFDQQVRHRAFVGLAQDSPRCRS